MQITDLYQTKITCSTYNANIDSTTTVITVKLVDFNNVAVKNKSVTLTCDKGYFNKNGSTTISGTTTKSITATTNDSGEISATWTASEWGLATFSANNVNNQIRVKGWKFIQDGNMGGATIKMYRNEQYGYIHSQSTMTTLSATSTFNNMFPSQMIPRMSVSLPMNYASNNNNKILLQNGESSILVHANSTSSKTTQFGLIYPLLNP